MATTAPLQAGGMRETMLAAPTWFSISSSALTIFRTAKEAGCEDKLLRGYVAYLQSSSIAVATTTSPAIDHPPKRTASPLPAPQQIDTRQVHECNNKGVPLCG